MGHRFPVLMMMVFLCIALSFPANAQADEGRLEIEDIFNLETVTDPQISPDGSRAAKAGGGATAPR